MRLAIRPPVTRPTNCTLVPDTRPDFSNPKWGESQLIFRVHNSRRCLALRITVLKRQKWTLPTSYRKWSPMLAVEQEHNKLSQPVEKSTTRKLVALMSRNALFERDSGARPPQAGWFHTSSRAVLDCQEHTHPTSRASKADLPCS